MTNKTLPGKTGLTVVNVKIIVHMNGMLNIDEASHQLR